MPKKSIVKKSDCKQISNPQKNFLIAAICVYIVILAMSFCGHYHMCGQNGDGSQQGGLWNVCNTLGCIFIMNQVRFSELMIINKPDSGIKCEQSTFTNTTYGKAELIGHVVCRTLVLRGSKLLDSKNIFHFDTRSCSVF